MNSNASPIVDQGGSNLLTLIAIVLFGKCDDHLSLALFWYIDQQLSRARDVDEKALRSKLRDNAWQERCVALSALVFGA